MGGRNYITNGRSLIYIIRTFFTPLKIYFLHAGLRLAEAAFFFGARFVGEARFFFGMGHSGLQAGFFAADLRFLGEAFLGDAFLALGEALHEALGEAFLGEAFLVTDARRATKRP
jgi:hypothetical protein